MGNHKFYYASGSDINLIFFKLLSQDFEQLSPADDNLPKHIVIAFELQKFWLVDDESLDMCREHIKNTHNEEIYLTTLKEIEQWNKQPQQ